jgi:hypothetical protein
MVEGGLRDFFSFLVNGEFFRAGIYDFFGDKGKIQTQNFLLMFCCSILKQQKLRGGPPKMTSKYKIFNLYPGDKINFDFSYKAQSYPFSESSTEKIS